MFLKSKNIKSSYKFSLGLVFHADGKNLDFCFVKKFLKNKENIFENISGSCELKDFKNLENYKDFKFSNTGFLIGNDLIKKFEIDLPKGCESDDLIAQQIEFILKKEHGIDVNKNNGALDYLVKNNKAHVVLTDVKNINFYLAWMNENNLKAVLAEPEEQAVERWEHLCHQVPKSLAPLPCVGEGMGERAAQGERRYQIEEKYQLAYSLAMGVFEWQGIK